MLLVLVPATWHQQQGKYDQPTKPVLGLPVSALLKWHALAIKRGRTLRQSGPISLPAIRPWGVIEPSIQNKVTLPLLDVVVLGQMLLMETLFWIACTLVGILLCSSWLFM